MINPGRLWRTGIPISEKVSFKEKMNSSLLHYNVLYYSRWTQMMHQDWNIIFVSVLKAWSQLSTIQTWEVHHYPVWGGCGKRVKLNTAFLFYVKFLYFIVYFLKIGSLKVLSFDLIQTPTLPTFSYPPYLAISYVLFKTSTLIFIFGWLECGGLLGAPVLEKTCP